MSKLLILISFFISVLISNSSFGKEFLIQEEVSKNVEITLHKSEDIEKLEYYLKSISEKDKWLEKEKESFIAKNRKVIETSLENGKKYIPLIISILIKHNLPTELVFIPAIESHYINGVKSPKGAAGIWQLMPQTARTFGLVVNRYVDERLDPIKSTQAAAKYLKHLYGIFGDWKLVLASYNAGHSKVITKVSYHGNSFSDIRRYLPKQTQNYLVKFLAFSEEGKRIINKNGLAKEFDIEVVEISGNYDLKTIAKLTYIPEQKLKELNKHFIKGVIPDDGNSYNLYVPAGYGKFVKVALNS
ncbi:MAG: lytic transglycosylase domain-containing protein [Hydrogenothermaceae bacterium]|nr:lytic transglycosylase domain-containing protein [Hydrogenothermaceae bacterium]